MAKEQLNKGRTGGNGPAAGGESTKSAPTNVQCQVSEDGLELIIRCRLDQPLNSSAEGSKPVTVAGKRYAGSKSGNCNLAIQPFLRFVVPDCLEGGEQVIAANVTVYRDMAMTAEHKAKATVAAAGPDHRDKELADLKALLAQMQEQMAKLAGAAPAK